ncbi:HAD family phosphatase [Lactobacillus sp. LC28-10]|uniref:HAD family phosphatase n=1 Tax=Secundilactobacillus angelensis TaxID=2722706 RepID=A0ABX1L1J6_9LACO|nr:Cof-type HAD-IIB family hydrolase [Secundilactobacillus angelensis]MCH5462332.1 Cof-type HAD-IIB family hydrolase [Secundilactobacillus angelensis]NLR18186.1 HAD family phosphatase [Secundilactobacillus angelensis]
MIKLVALDLDNTLLTNDKKISQVNELTLKKLATTGVKIVLCTGRPINAIWHYIEQLGLTGADDYTITFNGALVINNTSRDVLAKQGLSKTDLVPLHDFCKANGFPMDILDFEQVYPVTDLVKSIYTLGGGIKFNPMTFDELPDHLYAKVVAAQKPAELDQMIAALTPELHEKYHIARSQPHILEFLSPTTDKAAGLHALLQHFGWDESNLMAFGDAENDAGMLKAASVGVAMANAIPEITALTQYHTGTNEEDGVAEFVNQYFKLNE